MAMHGNQLLNRSVALVDGILVEGHRWIMFFGGHTGIIEAVTYDKELRGNGYSVLVRNIDGRTEEIPMAYLKLIN